MWKCTIKLVNQYGVESDVVAAEGENMVNLCRVLMTYKPPRNKMIVGYSIDHYQDLFTEDEQYESV